MGNLLKRQTMSFLVRVWIEYRDQMPPTWRGEIEHIGQGHNIYFNDLADIESFIQQCVDEGSTLNSQDRTHDSKVP